MEELNIRQEQPGDWDAVERTVKEAFAEVPYSDQSEHQLVARLRASKYFIPELSLVAVLEGRIVGHLLLTRIDIVDEHSQHPGLSLAPISVQPEFQNRSIGSQLIKASHKMAQQMGFNWIVLIGHQDYYPKFGYEEAQKYGITNSIAAPSENFMIKGLKPGVLDQIQGQVKYPKIYFE